MDRRTSSNSRRSLGALPVLAVAALLTAPGVASGAVLYDQTGNATLDNHGSNVWLPPNEDYTDQIADDFTVPGGKKWQISQVDVLGASIDTSSNVTVFIYANAGTLPGTELFHQTVVATNKPDYSIPVTGAPKLAPGIYWISVQQPGAESGLAWYWRESTVQSGNPAVYRNPSGVVVPTCGTGWVVRAVCLGDLDTPDELFKLSGTASAVAPPATADTGQRAAARKKCKKKHSKKARRKCRNKANLLPV